MASFRIPVLLALTLALLLTPVTAAQVDQREATDWARVNAVSELLAGYETSALLSSGLLATPDLTDRPWRSALAREAEDWLRLSRDLERTLSPILRDRGTPAAIRAAGEPLLDGAVMLTGAGPDVIAALGDLEASRGTDRPEAYARLDTAAAKVAQAALSFETSRARLPVLDLTR